MRSRQNRDQVRSGRAGRSRAKGDVGAHVLAMDLVTDADYAGQGDGRVLGERPFDLQRFERSAQGCQISRNRNQFAAGTEALWVA